MFAKTRNMENYFCSMSIKTVMFLMCLFGCAAFAANPVVDLDFNETSGLVAANPAGSGDAVLNNFATDDSQWVGGIYGGGLQFDGADDYVQLPESVATDHSYAYSFYIKALPMPYTGHAYIETSSNGSTMAMRGGDTKLNLYCTDNSWNLMWGFNSQKNVLNYVWHHVALVCDDGDVTLYVDGQVDNQASYDPSSVSFSGTNNALIGWDNGDMTPFNGIIDEFKSYEVALTPAEVQVLANGIVPGTKVAVFKDASISGFDIQSADAVIAKLQAEGYTVEEVTAAGLADPGVLRFQEYKTLVLTDAGKFPAAAKDNFLSFIKSSSNLIVLGGDFPNLEVSQSEITINFFEDYEPYQLSNITKVVNADAKHQSFLTTQYEITGNYSGLSAAIPKWLNYSMVYPILSAQDQHGIDRGWAASLAVHFDGAYGGSNWLACGITTPSFYQQQGFVDMLAEMLAVMNDPAVSDMAAAENAQEYAAEMPLTEPAPTRTIVKHPDGKGFQYSDGSPCFLTGVNYVASYDRWGWHSGTFSAELMEQDFINAKNAGINWFRIYGGGELFTTGKQVNALKECARKHGIFLELTVTDHTTYMTQLDLSFRGAIVASNFYNEPMVTGYDLQNEPYFWDLGNIEDNSGVTLRTTYPYYSHGEYDFYSCMENWLDLFDSDRDYGWHGSTYPGLTAEHFGGSFKDQLPSVGVLPVNADYAAGYDDVDGVYGTWASWLIDGIRAQDQNPNHMTTIGYNTAYGLLPNNDQLGLMSQHVYRAPEDDMSPWQHGDLLESVTTMDRLSMAWPDKPVCIGEFGFSNGIPDNSGGHLDIHNSGYLEFMHYLYSYVQGHAGVKKWTLYDLSVPMSKIVSSWVGGAEQSNDQTHRRASRFGMYYYNATKYGGAKPIVNTLKFFRDYLDEFGGMTTVENRGALQLYPISNCIAKTGYRYDGPNALFIGDVSYTDPSGAIQFTGIDKPANVMVAWQNDKITVMSSRDTSLTIDPSSFVSSMDVEDVLVVGNNGGVTPVGSDLQIEMLEGQRVEIFLPNANVNGTGIVDLADFSKLAYDWGQTGENLNGDINKDLTVDIEDLKFMAEQWLN